MEFIVGGLAAAGATFVTNPLAAVKHEMEMNSKSQIVKDQRTFLTAGFNMAKQGGLKSLQTGLGPALGAYFINYGLKLGTYHTGYNSGFTKNCNGEVIVKNSILLSGIGGVLGHYLSNPFYLLQKQVELDSLYKSSQSKKPENKIETYTNTIGKIYREHGLKGFFRGASASMPRAFIGASQLTSFAIAKENLSSNQVLQNAPLLVTFLASTLAAVILTLTMAPFDVVLTKLYKQATCPPIKQCYDGFFDCLKKTYVRNGLKPFSKSIGPLSVKLGPHTILCLVFWEQLRDIYDNRIERVFPDDNIYQEYYQFNTNQKPCDFYWS